MGANVWETRCQAAKLACPPGLKGGGNFKPYLGTYQICYFAVFVETTNSVGPREEA